jgi:hypothetical protein
VESIPKYSKSKKTTKDNYFTAYIMRGNKQMLKVNVKASKRFIVNQDTYIIKKDCIFTRIHQGKIESVAFYSEGNPNPYSFKTLNDGLGYEEFNTIYGEDLYDMLVKLQRNMKMFYLFMLYIFVMILAVITLISVFFIHV